MKKLPLNLEEKLDQAEVELAQALKEDGQKERLMEIPIARIHHDPYLQSRVAIKEERIDKYAELTEHEPGKLPPVKAFFNPELNAYYIWDGYTRLESRRRLGTLFNQTIPGLVKHGTLEDAIEAAAGANEEHGEGRTNDDQVKAIRNLLLGVSKWRNRSDREIAKVCHLSSTSGHKQVARIYAKMVDAKEIEPRPEHREGADGKTRKPPTQATGSMTQLESQTSLLNDTQKETEQISGSEPTRILIPSEGNGNGESYQHYCSPPSILEPTRRIAEIGLDVCHNKDSKWGARLTIDEEQDSLSTLWSWFDMLREDEIAPVNPPWSNMAPFVDELIKNAVRGKQWLLIGPGGSTAAVWYQKAAKSSALRIDPDKRISYYKEGKEDTSPRDPTVLFYWGHQVEKVVAIFSRLGWLVTQKVDVTVSAVELLRKQEFDARQQALPFLAAPEEDPQEKREKKCATTPCGDCGRMNLEAKHFFGRNDDDAEICCDCVKKRDAEPLMLHRALKANAKSYQQDGYEVSIKPTRGAKKFSVMGFLGITKDLICFQGPIRRDENDDAYTIEFCISEGNLPICTLYAVKKEASNEEEKEEEFPSPWMVRALKSIEEARTKEECVSIALPFIERATNDKELAELKEAFELKKAKLPSAENGRSPRAEPKPVDPLEKGFKEIKACNTVGEGKAVFDRLLKAIGLGQDALRLKEFFKQWKAEKPATKPYNWKEKQKEQKKSTTKAQASLKKKVRK